MSGPPPALSSGSPLVVVLGPTASGKTRFAIELAQHLDAEIVSADSRQVYRWMDIGTAKPTREERQRIPHHLIDAVDPDEPFSLGEYLRRARAAICAIRNRGRIPILAGGTAQYVWALVEGWDVPAVAPDLGLRARLEAQARAEGAPALHAELERLDPVAARAVHPHNLRRVIRALELWHATGARPSDVRARRRARRDAVIFALQLSRSDLYERIDCRVDEMFTAGLVREVEDLLARGYDAALPSMSAIGYTQVVQLLRTELSLADAIIRVKTASHRFARQQAAWFRLDDQRITWVDPGDVDGALARIRAWRRGRAEAAAGVIE